MRKTKRIISFMLLLFMLFGYFNMDVYGAEPTSYAPYPQIEYNYTTSVKCGTIRYMCQVKKNRLFYSKYWPKKAFGQYKNPEEECGTCSISMALSYIGINKTPTQILRKNNGNTDFKGWGAKLYSSKNKSDITRYMDRYVNGNGEYSPIIVHFKKMGSYSKAGHFVILAGKVSATSYQVLDCNTKYKGAAWILKTSDQLYKEIDHVCQYYNKNVKIGASGVCGEKLKWKLNSQGVLTIYGTGDMYDYGIEKENNAPWFKEKDYSVSTLVIEPGVTSIGNAAFYNGDLDRVREEASGWKFTKLVIPSGVVRIGDYAFTNCGYITSVTIPDSVKEIGKRAFSVTSIRKVSIPRGVSELADEVFDTCIYLTTVNLQDGLTTIGDRAFAACSKLKNVSIPDSVTEIGISAFYDCSELKNVSIPDSVTEIGMSAFWGTGLEKIEIPNGIRIIDGNTFENCKHLKEVVFPKNVEIIYGSFHGCSELESVKILNSKCIIKDLGGPIFPLSTTIYGYSGDFITPNILGSSIDEYIKLYHNPFVDLGA